MRGIGRDRIRKDTEQWIRRYVAGRRRVSTHKPGIRRPRKTRIPKSSIESGISRDQMPRSIHTAARPATRTAMTEILIRDIREAVISSAIIPIRDDLLKERQGLRRQRSSLEPYQAGPWQV